MKSAYRLICLAAPLLALAACKDKPGSKSPGEVEGEILPASVSDEMIPLDTIRSQPPLAPRSSGDARADKTDSEKDARQGE